jgi:stage II sporulation protein D
MSRYVYIVLLLLLSEYSVAEQRTLRVRLFWQHPPTKIHIVPERAHVRTCASCPRQLLSGAVNIAGQGSRIVVADHSSLELFLSGHSRVSGDVFPPFATEGELHIQSRDGFLLLTLQMSLEKYVVAVLQGESAGFKSEEALKAMAVAARTYAVHFGSRHRVEGFDFCDTTHCQDVRLGNESSRALAAAEATEGELLWFEGHPAATYYHRSCGGEIEDVRALDSDLHAPYLRRHHDDYCLRTSDEWESEISKSDLAYALNQQIKSVAVAARSKSGRVRTLLVNDRPIGATDVRLAIGRALGWDKVRSDLYQLEDLGDKISFRGRGQGHGVGLCQIGADSMGQEGHSYREILAFYYPGTAIGINAQGLAWEKLSGASIDLFTTRRGDATTLLPSAERALRFATQQTEWNLTVRPQLKVYPTISVYRDATGQPGWVAASTWGNTIHLQPISTLERAQALDSTLRHEFIHMLIESKARTGTPLWLREGLAIYLSNPNVRPAKVDVAALEQRLRSLRTEKEMRTAYRESAAAVAEVVEKNGRNTVLSWLTTPTLITVK